MRLPAFADVSDLWRRSPGHFKGHRLHCSPGTQEAAMKLLLQHVSDRSSVLDLASGSGAMVARLQEAGFRDLYAVERALEVFGMPETGRPQDAEVTALDLDGRFAEHYSRRFSLVVSVEVIEHLESPRDFLRQVHALLEEGGHLLLTTPNVANWVGRIRFLLLGDLRWFDERSYQRLRHISPFTDSQLRATLRELGFEVVASTSAGRFMGPLQVVLTAPLSLPFLAAFGRRVWGDCNVYLARKAAPTAARREVRKRRDA
jgi:2-polyprenyl-3-methyl-5-hydroxy-6-metoxy-1,4-benzoquinol methylase